MCVVCVRARSHTSNSSTLLSIQFVTKTHALSHSCSGVPALKNGRWYNISQYKSNIFVCFFF
jgi:hypothetical protein